MGLATAVSRLLGFARDCLIAAAYGTSAPAQAFVVAFRIPNLLRDLVAEGAANSAFVPVFSRVRALEGEASWAALSRALFSRLFFGFAAISILGVWLAPWLVAVTAPGFRSDPELAALTVKLTRILFPFVGLVGIWAFFMGLSNSLDRFTLPALGPIVLNLCMIGGLILFRPDALGISCGLLLGGILQIAIQWPALHRAGVRFRLRVRSHPGVESIGRMMGPRLVGSSVHQVGVLVDTIFASFKELVGAGGIATLYYAHRFLHLPMALFGISMAQAALPALSSLAARNDSEGVRRTTALALRSSLFVAVPSCLGLIALAHPIVETLLERGAFTPESTRMTVVTLQWYALGLTAMCTAKVLTNVLYAFHDTWTPVQSAALALTANVALNFLLVKPMGLAGLALATSLASGLNSWHLYARVHRRIGSLEAGLKSWAARLTAASLAMAVWARLLWPAGLRWFGISGAPAAAAWLLAVIALSAALFFGLALLLKLEEAQGVVRWLFRKS